MKKLLVVLVLSLSACGTSEGSASESKTIDREFEYCVDEGTQWADDLTNDVLNSGSYASRNWTLAVGSQNPHRREMTDIALNWVQTANAYGRETADRQGVEEVKDLCTRMKSTGYKMPEFR